MTGSLLGAYLAGVSDSSDAGLATDASRPQADNQAQLPQAGDSDHNVILCRVPMIKPAMAEYT
jgi:hypothetical protein